MKKKNIISLIISLIVVFNMVFCASALNDADTSFGTSEPSAESGVTLSAEYEEDLYDDDSYEDEEQGYTDEEASLPGDGLDENPLDSVYTDGDTIGAITTTDPLLAELDNLDLVTPGDVAGTTDSSNKKLDTKKILAIVAIIAAVAVIAVVAVVLSKKKNKGENYDYNNSAEYKADVPAVTMKYDIPVGEAKEIRYDYTFDGAASMQNNAVQSDISFGAAPVAAPVLKTDNFHDAIMPIYKGEAPVESFSGSVAPIVLANIYDLQVSPSTQPVFARGNDINSSDYILVDDKYLYLNYRVFYGGEFKLYSDIVAVEKCFDISNAVGAVASPMNQNILDIEPAVFEIDGVDFKITEKGKIKVQ